MVDWQVTVLWCKGCGRYLQPPKHWVRAELESKELLTFCIKRIKGLGKVRLLRAWAWSVGYLSDVLTCVTAAVKASH